MFTRRAAVGWALPLMLLMGGALVLPFVWRTGLLLSDCAQQEAGCALAELVADDEYLRAAWNTWWLSTVSALLGLLLGLGSAVALQQRPGARPVLTALASLGANLSGVPLAMALMVLLGAQGVIPLAADAMGWPLRLELQGMGGLLLAYVCFQAPLATLLLVAPVGLMDRSLQEAAATLGAPDGLFWRRVGLPLLLPSLVETFGLLFANAAAAFATPFALSGTSAQVLAVRMASLVSGDIFAQPELSALLALLLFSMMAVMLAASRWAAARCRRLLEGTS